MKPTTMFNKSIATASLLFVSLSSMSYGQGALAPPSTPNHMTGPSAALTAGGLPQPTMKTLQQIEPRVDVMTLASEANAHYVIARPGSYYLSSNIAASRDIAILVKASSVTVDLNGFEIRRFAGTGGTGIRVANGAYDVAVRNGRVSRFGNGVNAFGIFTEKTKGCVLENLQVTGCTGHGLMVGDGGVVRNCTSNTNGGHGIFADNGSQVISSVACGNAGSPGAGAIWVRNDCTLSHCTARGNTTSGIIAGLGCNLFLCTASENEGTYGISTEGGCTVKQCTADRNIGAGGFSRGISVGEGCTVMGCTARENATSNATNSSAQGVGIYVAGRSLVKNCTLEGNNGDALRCESDCRIEQNTCIDSGIYGAGIHANGDDNRIDGNHCTRNRYGIRYDGQSNLVIRNSAYGNGLTPESGNFSGDGADNAIGPFIYMNEINAAADDRPWGNFTKTPTIVLR